MDNLSLSHTKYRCQYHIVLYQSIERRYYMDS